MLPWDRFPSGNGPKKPLTKKQLRELQKAYAHAEEVAEEVAELEADEKPDQEKEAEEVLKTQFL